MPEEAPGAEPALARGAEKALRERVASELAAPVPEAVSAFARELARRHGPAVSAVVFYGSCLRKRTTEGVLDFYVVVDDYRSAWPSRALAAANALLPPNVVYCEWSHEAEPLRAKYAVLSARDFRRGASPRRLDCRVWARFSQPAALAFVRDDDARLLVVAVAAQACLTFVARAEAVLAGGRERARFDAEQLFQTGFRETYRAELRAERDETIREIHDAAADRYRAIATLALRALAERGAFELAEAASGFETVAPPWRRRRAQLGWAARRPVAKVLAIAGLLKTAFTFGDWVPYVLWKVERHTAVRVELTERQRRHPLIFGWPVVWRLIRQGVYR